jgi:hypothetical protein
MYILLYEYIHYNQFKLIRGGGGHIFSHYREHEILYINVTENE